MYGLADFDSLGSLLGLVHVKIFAPVICTAMPLWLVVKAYSVMSAAPVDNYQYNSMVNHADCVLIHVSNLNQSIYVHATGYLVSFHI